MHTYRCAVWQDSPKLCQQPPRVTHSTRPVSPAATREQHKQHSTEQIRGVSSLGDTHCAKAYRTPAHGSYCECSRLVE